MIVSKNNDANFDYARALEETLIQAGFSSPSYSSEGLDAVETVVDLISKILIDTQVLQKLRLLQELDMFDIECISQIYSNYLRWKKAEKKTEEVEEDEEERLFHFFDWEKESSRRDKADSSSRLDRPKWVQLIYEQIEQLKKLRNGGAGSLISSERVCRSQDAAELHLHYREMDSEKHRLHAHLHPNPYSDHFEKEKVRRILLGEEPISADSSDFVQKILREFLIAQTAKDCSLMITIRQKQEANDEDEDEDDDAARPVSIVDPRGKPSQYYFRIGIVDLDPKDVHRIPRYFQLDRDIVENFAESTLPGAKKTSKIV